MSLRQSEERSAKSAHDVGQLRDVVGDKDRIIDFPVKIDPADQNEGDRNVTLGDRSDRREYYQHEYDPAGSA